MKVKKAHAKQLFRAIDQWIADSVISPEDGEKLRNSIEVLRFDYKRLAKWSFWFAIGCFIISAGAFVISPIFATIVALFQKFFTIVDPRLASGIFLTALSGGLYYWGLRRRDKHPETTYKNEALFFLGVLLTAGAIGSFCSLIEGQKDFSPVFLIAAIIYGALGLYFPSGLVWVFALGSIGSWFGCETGYVSGGGEYFLGMNYPMRFIPFSACVLGLAYFFKTKVHTRYYRFAKPTHVVGLLYLFMSCWILSVCGYKESSNLLWSVLFGLISLGTIYYGLKNDDGPARGFGITFFLINLYTKYFERFWDGTDKTVFFFILGLSFWLIGSRAEKIWIFISQSPKATPAEQSTGDEPNVDKQETQIAGE